MTATTPTINLGGIQMQLHHEVYAMTCWIFQ